MTDAESARIEATLAKHGNYLEALVKTAAFRSTDVEDLLQEARYRLCRRIHQAPTDDGLMRSFLWYQVRNAVNDYYRKTLGHERRVARLRDHTPPHTAVTHHTESVEHRLIEAEQHSRARAVVNGEKPPGIQGWLSTPQREVLRREFWGRRGIVREPDRHARIFARAQARIRSLLKPP